MRFPEEAYCIVSVTRNRRALPLSRKCRRRPLVSPHWRLLAPTNTATRRERQQVDWSASSARFKVVSYVAKVLASAAMAAKAL